MKGRIYVVGVGAQGRGSLAPAAADIVDRASLLIGGERLLALFAETKAERLTISGDLDEIVRQVDDRLGGEQIVVLASGDPGFFGIAKRLVSLLGKERVEILPYVSAMQMAFARIKESWEDARFVSVHGRPLAGLAELVRDSPKVAILGDDENSPAVVARVLLNAGVRGYRAYLCENMGLPEESALEIDLIALAERATAPLSILILIREQVIAATESLERAEQAESSWLAGIPDDQFLQRRPRRGLITKAEVRLVSVARLGLRQNSIVWDIGAGCGSVAIEAALIARLGRVYAVERQRDDIALILQNVAKFGTENVAVVHGEAPKALETLPDPDAVFIGGSGGHLADILAVVSRRLRTGGRVVVNAATLETVSAAGAGLRERGFTVTTTLMQVSRSKELAGLTHFEALDPVFVVVAWHPGGLSSGG